MCHWCIFDTPASFSFCVQNYELTLFAVKMSCSTFDFRVCVFPSFSLFRVKLRYFQAPPNTNPTICPISHVGVYDTQKTTKWQRVGFCGFFSGLSFKQWQFYSKQKRFKRTTKISIHVFASINSHTNKKKMYCAAPTAPCTNSNNVCVINSCYHVMSRWLLPTSDYHSCREYVQKLFALLISTN